MGRRYLAEHAEHMKKLRDDADALTAAIAAEQAQKEADTRAQASRVFF